MAPPMLTRENDPRPRQPVHGDVRGNFHHNVSRNKMATEVTVTIKAANGLIDDFGVVAQPSWTIQQLKNHLYRHYPTHPVSFYLAFVCLYSV